MIQNFERMKREPLAPKKFNREKVLKLFDFNSPIILDVGANNGSC